MKNTNIHTSFTQHQSIIYGMIYPLHIPQYIKGKRIVTYKIEKRGERALYNFLWKFNVLYFACLCKLVLTHTFVGNNFLFFSTTFQFQLWLSCIYASSLRYSSYTPRCNIFKMFPVSIEVQNHVPCLYYMLITKRYIKWS